MTVSAESPRPRAVSAEDAEPASASASAPRPATPDEIVAMMDEAARQKREEQEQEGRRGGVWHITSFWLLWAGLFGAVAAIVFLSLSAAATGGGNLALALGVALLIALTAGLLAMKMLSPMLLAGVMLRRASGPAGAQTGALAGADILSALGLAERLFDADEDARLVTRRDGVVVYANQAYVALAQTAGVVGPAGLPPRIDRLFAQQGAEATKVFRLCRAAKGAERAQEIIYQIMGLQSGAERRRFEVTVHPIESADDYVAWRLRSLPVEEDEQDSLSAAYADYPQAVFAVEKSGQVPWANAAAREKLGAARGVIAHIDDIVLGETSELLRALWRVDRSGLEARVRRRDAEPASATFIAFRRGGVGEGFVCVELVI
ncbi:MAG: hypothetical protein ACX939_06380, partial [Hyphococcus sp.]